MIQMTFKSRKELETRIRFDDGCQPGVDWLTTQDGDLATIFRNCPLNIRVWAIVHGYVQLEVDCPWDELISAHWAYILIHRPELEGKFVEHQGWKKFSAPEDEEKKEKIIQRHPKFAQYLRPK